MESTEKVEEVTNRKSEFIRFRTFHSSTYTLGEPLFLFGAGASAPFGVPTMKEMVSQFEKELLKEKGSDARKEKRLYSEVESFLSKDFGRVDLESVFTVIDGIAQGMTLKGSGYLPAYLVRKLRLASVSSPLEISVRRAALRLRGKFEEFVKRVCWVKPEKLAEIERVYLSFLNEVYQVTRNGPQGFVSFEGANYLFDTFWTFFTTNYDNVIERFWREGVRKNWPLNTGFQNDPSSKTEILNSQTISQQSLRLLKLHGSITWWKEESTGNIVERDQPPDSSYTARKFGERIIVYPIQQKDTFVRPYFDLFYVLNQTLQQTKKWVVIGYSFADEILRAMFARSSTPETILVLVHPDNSVQKKIEEELGWRGHVRHVSAKFGEPETNRAVAQALQQGP